MSSSNNSKVPQPPTQELQINYKSRNTSVLNTDLSSDNLANDTVMGTEIELT